ncbi:class I SAM-dependent methyltransferase [Geopsychrobacter electrodiphilus]|uniref:class I SAM-dependent methyltransferase n=1 Tax=Geopsychrobacter electrodiphilus TaxID=225196 RepID=UPI000371E830|nr:class I SAM-dependent methyltransferase [Geopsychrobacter electrodiphilus]
MNEFDPAAYKKMVKSYQDRDDPTGWFNSIYTDAQGDHRAVFWADLEPNPYLLAWLKESEVKHSGRRAIVVGCGVGDDAEALSAAGYQVTAFDISPEAIRLCQKRYPDSSVTYLVADLFDYPAPWAESFALVYECNTIQVLPGKYRIQARDAMVSLLAPQGYLLVSCRSRLKGKQEDDIPLPLDKEEIDGFIRCGLKEESFEAYDDTQTPPVPHFFATYKK